MRVVLRLGLVTAVLAVSTVLGGAAAAPVSAAGLTMVELMPLPGHTWAGPVAMNAHGVVVGRSAGDGLGLLPVVWDLDGRPTALSGFGDRLFHPSDINDAGVIVGRASLHGAVSHATLWRPDGSVVDLGAAHPQLVSHAAAINNQGVVVGHVGGRAALWEADGRLVKLWSPAGAFWTAAEEVAEDGAVIGTAIGLGEGEGFYRSIRWDGADHVATLLPVGTHLGAVADGGWTGGCLVPPGAGAGRCQGAVWDAAGRIRAIGTLPGGTHSTVVAVNRHGAAVGRGDTGEGSSQRAIRWDAAGTVAELPAPADGVAFVAARDIADSGMATGHAQSHDWPPVTQALRWDRFGRVVELGTLPHTLGAIPIAVNDRGMVLGDAYSYVAPSRAVLWR